MRLHERGGPEERLDLEIERELAAIDAGLAGLPISDDLADLAELAGTIRDERPEIDAEFAALLDERAAAGFPRPAAARLGRAAGLRNRLRAVPPRRVLAMTGAAATLLVITGVAITALGGLGGGSGTVSSAPGGRALSGPTRGTATTASKPRFAPAPASPAAGNLRDTATSQAEEALPGLRARGSSAPATRKVARNANLTLSTDPGKVRSVADGVVQVTRRYRGLVISSQITSGKGGRPRPPVPLVPGEVPSGTGAEFQLRIPASKLEPALDDLSKLGLVVSRTEGAQDITGRFNSARERIGNLVSERDALIGKLASAVTTEAIDTIKHRLAVVRRLISRAEGQLNQLHERVRMVPVHVSVVARGSGAGGGSGGSFGIGDALHDAGRVLTVAAGVLLISLAVIAPLSLLALLAWLSARSLARWRRERALGI